MKRPESSAAMPVTYEESRADSNRMDASGSGSPVLSATDPVKMAAEAPIAPAHAIITGRKYFEYILETWEIQF